MICAKCGVDYPMLVFRDSHRSYQHCKVCRTRLSWAAEIDARRRSGWRGFRAVDDRTAADIKFVLDQMVSPRCR